MESSLRSVSKGGCHVNDLESALECTDHLLPVLLVEFLNRVVSRDDKRSVQ